MYACRYGIPDGALVRVPHIQGCDLRFDVQFGDQPSKVKSVWLEEHATLADLVAAVRACACACVCPRKYVCVCVGGGGTEM